MAARLENAGAGSQVLKAFLQFRFLQFRRSWDQSRAGLRESAGPEGFCCRSHSAPQGLRARLDPNGPDRGGNMDNVTIAEMTNLSVESVKRVRTQLNNNEDAMRHAIEEYLEYKSGPFRESKPGVDDWAESGKPRRAKKVRFGCRGLAGNRATV